MPTKAEPKLLTIYDYVTRAEDVDLTPKQLGEVADIYHIKRAERLAADKVAAKLKAEESMAEALLIAQMTKQEVSAAGGKLLRVSLNTNDPDYVPTVKDWTKFYDYIKENDAFELLERRPGKAACRERWDDGKAIPGVEKFPVYKLSRNEVK